MLRIILSIVMVIGISGGSAGGTVAPFDPNVTVDTTTTIGSGGTADWWGRASIKRRPSDDALVLVYYRATGHSANDGALHIKFSDDDGATWTDEDETLAGSAVSGFPMNPTVSAGQDAGEPWLYIAPNGDLLVHMWRIDYSVSAGGSYQSRSTDGGESWSTPAAIDFTGIAGDSLIFSTDDDFVFDGVIYAAARVWDDAAQSGGYTIFIKSTDDGETWEYVSDITASGSDTQEVGMEYVGNDRIVAMVRDLGNTTTTQAVSADFGATWTTSDVTSAVTASGRHRIYTRSHLQGLSGWWKDPVLVMVGFELTSPGSSTPRRNAIWVSPDRGATWDGPHYLDAQVADAGYSDIFWNGSGYSVVSYQGTLLAASLKQYDLSIDFAP